MRIGRIVARPIRPDFPGRSTNNGIRRMARFSKNVDDDDAANESNSLNNRARVFRFYVSGLVAGWPCILQNGQERERFSFGSRTLRHTFT